MIGREDEIRDLDLRLARAREGVGQVVLVEGEPGIGKTTLVASLAPPAGWTLVTATCDETETDLPGGMVEQLLGGVGSPYAQPSRPDANPTRDAFASGAALVDAIGEITRETPVVVSIDDIQWADRTSLDAMTFALRRLREEPVLTVMTTRPGGLVLLPAGLQRLLDSDAGQRIELGGLAATHIRELVRNEAGLDLSVAAGARLTQHAGGNPLHTMALAREVEPSELVIGTADLPAPLAFEAIITQQLTRCAPHTRALVDALAIIGNTAPLWVPMELAGLSEMVAARALDEAAALNLLGFRTERRGRILMFTHPLVRAAVYGNLSSSRRAALHADAAALSTGQRERLRHLVGAAASTNVELAQELEEFAVAEAARGAFEASAKACLDAARVAADRSERERLVLSAAGVLIRSNDPSGAAALGNDIASFAETPLKAYIEGILAAVGGDLDQGMARLVDGWKMNDAAADPSYAQAVASRLVGACVARSAFAEAADWLREIARLNFVDEVDDPGSELLLSAVVAGGIDLAVEFLDDRPDLFRPGANGWPRGVPGLVLIRAIGPDADPRGALATAKGVVEHYRHHGPPSDWLCCLERIASGQFHLGLWDDVITTCETLRAGADAVNLPIFADVGSVNIALVQCHRGDADGARATMAEFDPMSMVTAPLVAMVNAELASNAGDDAAAVEFLAPLAAFAPHAMGLCEPSYLPWRQDYVPKLIALGRLDDARPHVEWLQARTADRPYPSVVAAAARCAALLAAADGDAEIADKHFGAAIEASERSHDIFETAKIQLDRGALLRREGKRSEASGWLDAARASFTALRAAPWIDRCDHESGLLGRKRQRRDDSAAANLTPAEHAVARHVAEGATNREVAARLVVSIRTVEYHLSNIYSKLGISSRSQLVRALDDIS